MITRREKIARYLKEYTEKNMDKDGIDLRGLTALDISNHFKIDRTTSSRELNALYNDGIAMKFLGRPTHYLHYRTVLSTLTAQVPSTIPVGLNLRDYLEQEHAQSSGGSSSNTKDISLKFSPYDYSFQHEARLCEAAIRYPRPELHCLFILPDSVPGNSLASAMLSYGQQIGRFAAGVRLHTYECHFVLKNISAYHISLQLFGASATSSSSAKKGLIEKANESILFLNNIQYMPPSIEERFQALLMQNTFSRYGEDNFVRRNNTLIVASCSKEAYANNESSIFQYFPMKVFFPAICDWTAEDLFHYICTLFQKQAQILDMEIRFGKDLLYYLLCAVCSGNSVSIQAQIKQLCAAAYAKNRRDDADYLDIYPEYLPEPLLTSAIQAPRSSEFSNFLNEHFQTYIYISKDSIPFVLPAPAPAAPYASNGGSEAGLPVSNYLKSNLETYLEHLWHARSSRPGAPNICSAALYNLLEQDTRFPSLEKSSPLFSWSARLLDAFLENMRKNKEELPFDSSDIKTYTPDFILETAGRFTEQLNLSFSDSRRKLFALYCAALLDTIYQWCRENNILAAVLYRDPVVCRSIAAYLESCYHIPVAPLYLSEHEGAEHLHAQISSLLKEQTANCQLLLFLQEIPLAELDAYISRTFRIPVKCFSNVSLNFIAEALQKITEFQFSLPMLTETAANTAGKNTTVIPGISSLVLQAVNRLLEPSLNFINIYKVLPLMNDSLKKITDSLDCPLTDELAIKYFFHCAHMIERLIRKEPLHYPGIKAFANNHSSEFHVVEFSLDSISEYYGFKIPAAEIAYLTEIFL